MYKMIFLKLILGVCGQNVRDVVTLRAAIF